MDHSLRQVDNCSPGLWLQKLFQALCLILSSPLDPWPRVAVAVLPSWRPHKPSLETLHARTVVPQPASVGLCPDLPGAWRDGQNIRRGVTASWF